MLSSKVTKKGQTTLPKRIREALHLQSGESVVYHLRGNDVLIRRHPGVGAAFGILKPKQPVDIDQARQEGRKHWVEEISKEGTSSDA
ncbi:MAG: AbrB/MazE/SpoVT family DNA-binding domain-containing protein [Puniceicoccaceae bacterium]